VKKGLSINGQEGKVYYDLLIPVHCEELIEKSKDRRVKSFNASSIAGAR
jgi:hypothetical protein